MPKISVRKACREAARHVSMPWGRGTSWTFSCPWQDIGGPLTEVSADSYWRALAKRRAVVALIAVQIMGGDLMQVVSAQYYVDAGYSAEAAVAKVMEGEE